MKNTLRVFVPVLFSILAFGASAPSAFAATNYFVDPIGTDNASFGTTTGSGAFKTIQYAIDSATTTGDTIDIATGIYPEKLLISGKTNLTLQGHGVGSLIEPASQASSAGITIMNSNGLKIQDLKIHTAGY